MMLQRQGRVGQRTTVRVRRPAVVLAGAFLLGIVAQAWVGIPPGWGLVGVGLLAALSLLDRERGVGAGFVLCLALFMAGIVAGRLESNYYAADEVGLFTTAERRLAQLEVTLEDPPRVLKSEQAQRPLEARQLARGRVSGILTKEGWRAASGEVLLHIEPPDERLKGGETIRAAGWLGRVAPAMNPGQFDFAAHYRAERVLATFSVRRVENVAVVSRGGWFTPVAALRAGARSLLGAGFTEAHSVDHALLRALLLGDNDPQLRDIQDLFVRTGTSHHLSISGLHVAVLAGFVYFVCRVLRLAPRTTAVVTLGFVMVYATAALPNPPVVRSVLLCAFVIVGTLVRRAGDLIQLLALSVFGMLVYSPLDLYDVGFELSFGTVLGLMLFTRPLTEAVFPVDPDMALAPKRKVSRVRAWVTWGWRHLREAVCAAVVAWFVSLPMILYHFDRLNPWATVASVLLAPVVFAGLIGGLLKIVFTMICPPLAWMWADAAGWPIALMRHSVDWLARLPGSDVTLRPVPVSVMLLYYASLCAALVPSLGRKTRRALVGGACGMILVLPVVLTAIGRHHPDETRVTILAVGAGSCAVVETDAGKTFLVDAGSSGSPAVYRNVIEPFLRERGIRRVDGVFVSHADFDHFGAVADVARGVGIQKVYLTPQFKRDAEESPAAAGMLRALPGVRCPTETVEGPRSVRLSDNTTLDVVWPPAEGEWSTNDSSMVLRLTAAGKSVLFPGDIQSAAMRQLLADPGRLKADVLVAPHHGSFEEDATEEFVAAVGPTWVVSSDDSTPTGKQRTFDEAFRELNPMHTHVCGAVTVAIRRDGSVTVEPFLAPASP